MRGLVAIIATAALAGSAPAPVLGLLAHQVTAVRGHDGGVAVLLPATMPLPRPLYGARVAQPRGYQLVLGSSPGCDGSLICAIAIFTATPGGRPDGARVALAHGLAGTYAPRHCAGDCTAVTIGWREGGILYTIAARPHGRVRAALVAAADRAIDAGPR